MGFFQLYSNSNVKIKRVFGILLLVIIIFICVCSCNFSNNYDVDTEDKNVYLNETIQYAKDIYISVIGINVISKIEDDNEQYILNLNVKVESKHDKFHIFSAKLSNKNFKLKVVDLQSKSKMAIFFEALAKETLEASLEIAIEGSINIIDETLNCVGNYIEGSIENASAQKDFKPIKAISIIKKFNPCKISEPKVFELTFIVDKEYLECDNAIVLSIDSIKHIEKHIFLTLRPNDNSN